MPGSNPVDLQAKFPLKLGQNWKMFVASPVEATIRFPAVVLSSAPQLFHPAVFTEGILSGTISITRTLQSPNINGEIQLLNGVLQSAPLDLNRASGRMTFNGEDGTLEFLNAATKDVDFSLKGEVDFRSSNDVGVKISSTTQVFDTTTSVQNCVRSIQISPVDVTLAPTVAEVELRGGLFGSSWKMTVKELGPSPAATLANPLTREFHFCASETPPGEVFTFGVHPRPKSTVPKSRKSARSR